MAATTTARTRKPSTPPPAPAVTELAEQWLTAKRALELAGQAAKGHSDRARRADLARWGRLLPPLRTMLPMRTRGSTWPPTWPRSLSMI